MSDHTNLKSQPKLFPLLDFNLPLINISKIVNQLFHDGCPCHIETSPWICIGNSWTGFYIRTSVMEELNSGNIAD